MLGGGLCSGNRFYYRFWLYFDYLIIITVGIPLRPIFVMCVVVVSADLLIVDRITLTVPLRGRHLTFMSQSGALKLASVYALIMLAIFVGC